MKGAEHLFVLALKAENVVRQAYQADAYVAANSQAFATLALERALAAAEEVAEVAKAMRAMRGEDSTSECATCDGSGKIVEAARTSGANQHSACQRDCDECDGTGRQADAS